RAPLVSPRVAMYWLDNPMLRKGRQDEIYAGRTGNVLGRLLVMRTELAPWESGSLSVCDVHGPVTTP
ncbi:MAG TPA: hypothetical protein PK156_43815, partial [Polyangium sp.]|nr:hypothetical protein [Polyangium sp.]